MAIYWIDFMQSTNGTGTYSSPFSGATAQTLAQGDEIRVKSVLKSAIWDSTFGSLTPGSYKMVYNSNKNGASNGNTGNKLFKHSSEPAITFNSSYLYYIVETDQFFITPNSTMGSTKFNGISETHISLTQGCVPPSWNDGLDHICTIKLVHINYRAKAQTGSSTILGGSTYISGVTITDGWTSETTRVTDGSVITLFQSGYSSGTVDFYIQYLRGNSVIDLSNTVFADRTYGGAYYVQNLVQFCGVCDIKIGSKVSTYSNSTPFQISKQDDSVVGNLNITLNSYTCYSQGSYNLMYNQTLTYNLTTIVDIKKLFTHQCVLQMSSDNSAGTNILKLGDCNINSYYSFSTYYTTIYNTMTTCLNPFLVLYGTISVNQQLSGWLPIMLIGGSASTTTLKNILTGFSCFGISGNAIVNNFCMKDGTYLFLANSVANNLFFSKLQTTENPDNIVVPDNSAIMIAPVKSLYNVPKVQIEYNPIKTTIKGLNKGLLPLMYDSTYNALLKYGSMIYYPDSDNYTYFLAKINDSTGTDLFYSNISNRCIMEESTTTYKTVSPSYKVACESASSSFKEFFHRWNIPVESSKTYTLKFYTGVSSDLPSSNFKNYNFALRYNYSSVITKAITSLSQGGWEEHSFTFTSTSAQIVSLDMFFTQNIGMNSDLFISDFSITEA